MSKKPEKCQKCLVFLNNELIPEDVWKDFKKFIGGKVE